MGDKSYEQARAEEIRDRASNDLTKSKSRGIIIVRYDSNFTFTHVGMGPGESLDILRDVARYLKTSMEKIEKEVGP